MISMKPNKVYSPIWLEANQLAFDKSGRGVELGTTKNKSW